MQIEDAALVAAASLSHRYIPARQLPDKAIDLVDEAASRLRMEIDSSPVEIDELQRQVDRLRMEEMALASETDEASKERLAKLRADLADLQEQLGALQARWEQEKAGLNRVGELKEQVDAKRDRGRARAARGRPRDGVRACSTARSPRSRSRSPRRRRRPRRSMPMVKETVGPDDIAEVVAAWTGIPAGRLLEGEAAEAAAHGGRARAGR